MCFLTLPHKFRFSFLLMNVFLRLSGPVTMWKMGTYKSISRDETQMILTLFLYVLCFYRDLQKLVPLWKNKALATELFFNLI